MARIGQAVAAALTGAAAGAVAALGPAEAARRVLVVADRRWWAFYRRALILLGEEEEGFGREAPDPADVAVGLRIFTALDRAAALRATRENGGLPPVVPPGEADLAFRIFHDPEP